MKAETSFPCWLVDRDGAGEIVGGPSRKTIDELPPGDILVEIELSSLNYKDGLAATGNPGVAKRLPHIPGIDAVGTVAESADPGFHQGERVILSGGEFGAANWGGWTRYARLNADFVLPMPRGLNPEEAAALGVAGFTAALSVRKLIAHGVKPGSGEILVTGATGGVGCVAVALLAKLGYEVVAVTGKQDKAGWLLDLGASRVVGRSELKGLGDAPLLKSRWAAGIDTVGGEPLAALLRSTKTGGCVTTCGLVAGADLVLTVHPFILRGLTLCGIDSAWTPRDERAAVWKLLGGEWKLERLDRITRKVALSALGPEIEAILAGKIAGRSIVEVDK
ncbi:MAG TPA: YhdH/YhfP family quinone oxidoreductase [Rectinemataceae bacterium]|nr:YhdH/YhfP family quinone oxidoreductase [Rectinemataceae bacterium]